MFKIFAFTVTVFISKMVLVILDTEADSNLSLITICSKKNSKKIAILLNMKKLTTNRMNHTLIFEKNCNGECCKMLLQHQNHFDFPPYMCHL